MGIKEYEVVAHLGTDKVHLPQYTGRECRAAGIWWAKALVGKDRRYPIYRGVVIAWRDARRLDWINEDEAVVFRAVEDAARVKKEFVDALPDWVRLMREDAGHDRVSLHAYRDWPEENGHVDRLKSWHPEDIAEDIRRLEAEAGERDEADPIGDQIRTWLRSELDDLDLDRLTVPVLRAVCKDLGRATTGKTKAGLVDQIKWHPLERIGILFSADS